MQVATPTGTVTLSVSDILAYESQAPRITKVVNAASSESGVVAPGEFVSIYGSLLGPAEGVGASSYDKGLAGVQVTFNGIDAFVTYASQSQINALIPYGVTEKADAVVEYKGLKSDLFPLQVVESAPGIFTKEFGAEHAWVVNQDNTFNSPINPAGKGTAIAFFATGQGLVDPPGQDGEIIKNPKTVRLPVKVSFSNGPQLLPLFSGLVYTGVLQVNVQVPNDAPSGNVELLLTVGNVTSRRGVTVSLK